MGLELYQAGCFPCLEHYSERERVFGCVRPRDLYERWRVRRWLTPDRITTLLILIREIGYHVWDYFVKQWRQFKHVLWGVLAHSTYLKGTGTLELGSEGGQRVECPSILVTLATGIPQETCHTVNLGYRDPLQIDIQQWSEHGEDEVLVVQQAGEYLYRLKQCD